jgi:general secretion pathway protein H
MKHPDLASAAGGTAGFTLIELLTGLAILSAIALVTLPLSRTALRTRALDAATSDLASAVRMTRASAVREGRERDLEIDLDAGTYWSQGVLGKQQLASSLSIRVTAAAGETAPGGVQRIRFLPGGEASGAQIMLSDGKRAATVRIDWLTGAAHVSR